VITLILRDLRIAVRAGGGFGLSLAFFFIIVIFFPFSIGPNLDLLSKVAPGTLWVGALLACLLSLERIFALDFEDGTLDLLATSPIPLEGVVIAKAFVHWLTTGLPLILLTPFLGVLLGLQNSSIFFLVISLIFGTPALSIIGTFGAALTAGMKRGGLLLSILVLPLFIPTLIFGAEAARRGIEGFETQTSMLLLLGITLLSWAILPFAAASVLKINLR
jgi:heme exporter protein B